MKINKSKPDYYSHLLAPVTQLWRKEEMAFEATAQGEIGGNGTFIPLPGPSSRNSVGSNRQNSSDSDSRPDDFSSSRSSTTSSDNVFDFNHCRHT